MVAPRPYHQFDYRAAGERRCFACAKIAASCRRGEECPGAAPLDGQLIRARAETARYRALLREAQQMLVLGPGIIADEPVGGPMNRWLDLTARIAAALAVDQEAQGKKPQ